MKPPRARLYCRLVYYPLLGPRETKYGYHATSGTPRSPIASEIRGTSLLNSGWSRLAERGIEGEERSPSQINAFHSVGAPVVRSSLFRFAPWKRHSRKLVQLRRARFDDRRAILIERVIIPRFDGGTLVRAYCLCANLDYARLLAIIIIRSKVSFFRELLSTSDAL